MHYRESLQLLADYITTSLAACFPGHPVLGVINERAGTVTRHGELEAVVDRLPRSLPPPSTEVNSSTVWTDSVEALQDVLSDWFDRSVTRKTPTPIVVSLGGDGTHNQVMRSVTASAENIWFFRVPIGSGNDAVGIDSLQEVLASLSADLAPVWVPEVEVVTPRRTLHAFNIASVGIDAFVTMMHDRLRRVLPGNTYRIVANIAILAYERLVNLAPLHIVTADEDLGSQERILVAFGVHGKLTYGDHIRILPGDDNLCIFRRVSLRQKLRMKRLIFRGEHVNHPITTMRQTREITLHYNQRLPVQVDGEADWLEPDDFPLIMRTRERARRVLQIVPNGEQGRALKR